MIFFKISETGRKYILPGCSKLYFQNITDRSKVYTSIVIGILLFFNVYFIPACSKEIIHLTLDHLRVGGNIILDHKSLGMNDILGNLGAGMMLFQIFKPVWGEFDKNWDGFLDWV